MKKNAKTNKKTKKTVKPAKTAKPTPVNALEFFNASFAIVDSQGNILNTNDNFSSLTGYTSVEMKNEPLEKYFKSEDLNDIFAASGKPVDGEGVISTKDGNQIEATFHAGPIKDSEEKLFVIHFIKSHKLKKHIDALNEAKDILKERISDKDRELKRVNAFLENANKEISQAENTLRIINSEMLIEENKKSEYIRELINQYKKPLEYISKVADIILTENLPDEELRQRFIANLENKARYLQNSINFLYEWENEKIRGTGVKIEDTEIKNFINEIEYYLEDKLSGKILKFELPKENLPMMLVDKRRLKEIFIDILVNAINCLTNDRILIKAAVNKNDGEKFVFSIINSGIGIPDEYQLKLFDKYSYLRDVNFSPLELNFPVFNDILSSFGSHLTAFKQKNKEDLIRIEVPVSAHIKEPVKEKEPVVEMPVKEKKEIKQEFPAKRKKPVVKKIKRKRKIKV